MKRYLIQLRNRSNESHGPILKILIANNLEDLKKQILDCRNCIQDQIDILSVEDYFKE